MLFNSYIFWVFLAVVLLLYRFLGHRGQNRLLLLAGCVFYGAWDWRFLFLLWFTIVLDFFTAQIIDSRTTDRGRKIALTVSIVSNLAILGFFKYYGFFSRELAELLERFGIHASLPVLRVVLPVGVSFYTFQSMSYTVDVYRRQVKPVRVFLDYAAYVLFFPQLVAGPIERATSLLPQVLNPERDRCVDFREGLYYILLGLFKKVVIADNMASIASTVFRTPVAQLSGPEVLVGIYAFAFQIYGDFSGYSSIAQGVARWLGFRLMDNFRHPYFAVSPSDFWRRWHISLSTWLRDYLYIPLGGNRGGGWLTYRNLLLTMLLGGLWHGANWTFIAWGLYHGLLLCGFRWMEGVRPPAAPALGSRLVRMALMFHLVCLSWLFFRAESITQVAGMLGRLLTDWQWTPFSQFALATTAFYVLPLLLYEAWVEHRGDLVQLTRTHWLARGLAYSYIALMLLFFHAPVPSEFIYFQF